MFIGAAVICLAFAPRASASGILNRASCSMVQFYVAKYSAPGGGSGQEHGATDAEIEAARRRLKDAPLQTATIQNLTDR
jgi:hypothetical protein